MFGLDTNFQLLRPFLSVVLGLFAFLSPSAKALSENQAREYSFVFVDGMFGEYAKNNFDGAVQRIQAVDESAEVTILRPQTTLTFEENAALFLQHEAIKNPEKPLLIFAHSRGAAEVLLALLNSDETVLNNVAQAVLIQGSFYGSPLSGKSIEKFEDWCATKMMKKVKQLCDQSSSFLVGFRGLSSDYVSGVFINAIRNSTPEKLNLIRSKVSYLRARTSLGTASFPLKPLYLYLKQMGYPENDGVVVTSQQKIQGLGLDLGVYQSDHTGLTGGKSKRRPQPSSFFSHILQRLWANDRIQK